MFPLGRSEQVLPLQSHTGYAQEHRESTLILWHGAIKWVVWVFDSAAADIPMSPSPLGVAPRPSPLAPTLQHAISRLFEAVQSSHFTFKNKEQTRNQAQNNLIEKNKPSTTIFHIDRQHERNSTLYSYQ